MGMKKRADGFTILETLIVLAITGILLAIALVNLTHTDKSIGFKTAALDFQQELQSVINKAATTYSSSTKLTCTGTETPNVPPLLSTGSSSQGTNIGCYYIGVGLAFRQYGVQVIPLVVSEPASGGSVTTAPDQPIDDVAPVAPTDSAFTTPATPSPPDLSQYYGTGGLIQGTDDTYPGTINTLHDSIYAPAGYFIAVAYAVNGSSTSGAEGLAPYVVQNPQMANSTGYQKYWTYIDNGTYKQYTNDYYYNAELFPAVWITECYNSGSGTQSVQYTISSSASSSTYAGGVGVSAKFFETSCPNNPVPD